MANNNTTRNFNLGYEYSFSDRNGTVDIGDNTTAPIHVGYASNDLVSHSFAMQLQHPNYLSLNLVHQNGNKKPRNNRNKVVDPEDARANIGLHKRAESTYQQHVDDLLASGIQPVMLYSVHGEAPRYHYVPQEFRVLLKGAVDLLLHIHSRNHALAKVDLTLKNLQIGLNGELMICDVDFVVVNHEDKNTLFRNDWVNLRALFFQIFEHYENLIPEDMGDLLDFMSRRYASSKEDECYMANHIALLLSKDRIAFIKKFYSYGDTLKASGNHFTYHKAIGRMTHRRGWITNIFNNPASPAFSAVQRCYNFGLSKNIRYTDDSICAANYSIIKCARDIATHLVKHFGGQSFGTHDIDIMLMATFESAIVEFHRGLHFAGVRNSVFEN